MWTVLVAAMTVAVGSVVAIPAAVGASPQAKTGATPPLCTATGKTTLGNAGVISLATKGSSSSTGTVVSCHAKVTGKWAKNSTTFSFDATGNATLGKGGAFTLDPKTNLSPLTGKVTGALVGSGLSQGTALTIVIHCWYSYPPLRYGCEIIISRASSSAAPRSSVGAAPHMKAGASAPLCTATGTKPLGTAGVVNVSVKGATAGTAVKCSGTLVGKWLKNSTQFSWDTSGQTTLGPGGAFRGRFPLNPVMGIHGKMTGTLTGSGLPTGSNLTIDAGCQVSYPPLKIRCWIIVSAA